MLWEVISIYSTIWNCECDLDWLLIKLRTVPKLNFHWWFIKYTYLNVHKTLLVRTQTKVQTDGLTCHLHKLSPKTVTNSDVTLDQTFTLVKVKVWSSVSQWWVLVDQVYLGQKILHSSSSIPRYCILKTWCCLQYHTNLKKTFTKDRLHCWPRTRN